MGKKTFTADLSVSGLNALKKQLLQYRDDLPIKCKQLVSSLLQSGVEVAKTNISESPLGKYVTVSTNISADKIGCDGILLAKGQVKEQDGYAPFSILLCAIWVIANTSIGTVPEMLMAVFTSIVQGVLVAGLSVYGNQLIKQIKSSE